MTEPNACPSPTPYERLRWHYGIPEALLNDFMAQVRASSASAGATPEPHPLRDWNLLSRETQDHDCTLGAEAMIDEHLPVLTHSVRWHLAQRCLRAVSRGGSSGATA